MIHQLNGINKMLNVSQTILAQLGGNKFIVMTSAHMLASTEKSLSMKIGKNSKKVTHVKITLDSSDTYTVESFYIRASTFKTVCTKSDVYADKLQAVFTEQTGLYTSL